MIGQLNLTVWALIESLKGLREPRAWPPFLVLGAGLTAILLLLNYFDLPAVAWAVVPLVDAVWDKGILHYPLFYQALPALFGRFNILFDWLAGSYIFGVAALVLWRLAAGQPLRGAWGEAGRRYFSLLLLRLPVILFVAFSAFLLPGLMGGEDGQLRGNALRLFRYGSFIGGVVVEAAFLYGALYLLVKREGVGRAIGSTLALFGRTAVAGILVVLIPNILQLGTSFVMRRSDVIVDRLAPETVGWLLFGSILVYMAVNYFVLASAVRIYGARAGEGGGR